MWSLIMRPGFSAYGSLISFLSSVKTFSLWLSGAKKEADDSELDNEFNCTSNFFDELFSYFSTRRAKKKKKGIALILVSQKRKRKERASESHWSSVFFFLPFLFCVRARWFLVFAFRPSSLGVFVGVPSFVHKKPGARKKRKFFLTERTRKKKKEKE